MHAGGEELMKEGAVYILTTCRENGETTNVGPIGGEHSGGLV